MDIDTKHLDGKPRRIGTLNGNAVMEIRTTGGFHMVVAHRPGKGFETLGTGPHKAVAKHIAKKREKEIVWSDLSKGDWIDPSHFATILPEYEALTDRFRALGKGN